MGQMRFYAPQSDSLLPHAAELAYVAGLEAVPWRSVNSLSDHLLTIDRSISESGNLYIPWLVPDIGQRVLSTCTLMERQQPYGLTTELARGTVHRARSLAGEMQARGSDLPARAQTLLQNALQALLTATTTATTTATAAAPAAAEQPAQQAIALAAQAIEVLMAHHTDLTLRQALDGDHAPTTILAGTFDSASPPTPPDLATRFTDAFHAACVPFRWRDCQRANGTFDESLVLPLLDWCAARDLRVIGGPLIQLDALSLPDFALDHAADYEHFEAAAVQYVQSTVTRFRDRVDIWVCAGRLNVPGAAPFSEEQKLRLAVATLEAVRSAAPRTPVVISFDQPWAEYLAREDFDLSPLHFADALVRADLGVAGVGIEMNLGYWPHGSQPRDLLAVSRHLDRWSLLGIPLLVYLRMPSQATADGSAVGSARVVAHSPAQPDRPAADQQLAADLIRLMLTKPAVHGVIWNQWSDAPIHEFPHAGLLDSQGCCKPLLESLARMRKTYLSGP